MGRVELGARHIRRNGYIQSSVLTIVGLTGLIAVAAIAPHMAGLIGALGVDKRLRNSMYTTATRMAKKGFVKFETRNGRKYLRITDAGRLELERATKFTQSVLKSERPKRWDKRWRMLIFDIPERNRAIRNTLRRALLEFGFLRLQGSVWIYPYDCEELVTLLKADLRIGRDMLYVVVEKIENDGWICRHFNLRR